jgi:putative ABC transport system permease protein
MRWFHSLLRRLRSLLRKDSTNVELSEELLFHVERQTEENIALGMSPEEARAAARESFGSVAQATEESYESRGVALVDDLAQDVRYGVRTLIRQRSFTVITVLTLALGIGACTAIFSLVNAVLLRSLPYGSAEKLVYLFTPNPLFHLPPEVFGPSNADFFDLKRQSHSYSEMTLFSQATYNLAVGGQVVRAGAAKVDANFFSTLRAGPELGRMIDLSDEAPGHDRVAVISHSLWQNMFSGGSDILGRTLQLNGASYQVVGVMPPDFGYPHFSDLGGYGNSHVSVTQLWLPSALTAQEKADRDGSSGYAVARLKSGVSVRKAQTEMGVLMAQLDLLHHANTRGWGAFVKPFRDTVLGPVRPLMLLLMGAVAFVLLIACGNATNLLLARAANRTHELGVRATLGARRGRLVRQMLTESLMLSVTAGIAGVGLAWLFLHALLKLNPGDIPRMQDARLDIHVMLFLAAVTLLTSVLFGVLPSFSASRINLAEFLKSGGTRGTVGDRKRLRSALTIAQVALVVVLLTGAGLLLRSYVKVLSVPTGFSASTVALDLELSPQVVGDLTPKYGTGQKVNTFFRDLLERVRLIHGIQASGLVDHLPLSHSESITTIEVEGYPNLKNQLEETRRITPDYLSAMQIPLVNGRIFTDQDGPEHPLVAIVNQAFVKKYFGGNDPIGRRVRGSADSPWTTIVGEVGDVRNLSLETAAAPQLYRPFWLEDNDETPTSGAYLTVRSLLHQDAVVSEIRAAVRSLDPELAVSDIHTMRSLETEETATRRFQTMLLTVFSGIAMLLAIVGVYGLLAYSVRRRTGEIGLRMALGSSRAQVVRLVLLEGFRLVAIGLFLGVGAAAMCTRLVAGFLYDVPAIDPLTFCVVPLLLLVATLAACLIPSVRAAAVDPMDALRHE